MYVNILGEKRSFLSEYRSCSKPGCLLFGAYRMGVYGGDMYTIPQKEKGKNFLGEQPVQGDL